MKKDVNSMRKTTRFTRFVHWIFNVTLSLNWIYINVKYGGFSTKYFKVQRNYFPYNTTHCVELTYEY